MAFDDKFSISNKGISLIYNKYLMRLREMTDIVQVQSVDYSSPDIRRKIQELDKKIFTDEYINTQSDSLATWWFLLVNGEIAGYFSILPRPPGGYLSRSGLLPKFRGRGLQKTMIKARVNYAKKQNWSWVVTDTHKENFASIKSLKDTGFVQYKPKNPRMKSSWIKQSYFWIKRL